MGAIIEMILGAVLKLLPFLLAYKAGKDSSEKADLKETVKEAEVRNAVEAEDANLDRKLIIDKLRQCQDK